MKEVDTKEKSITQMKIMNNQVKIFYNPQDKSTIDAKLAEFINNNSKKLQMIKLFRRL